MNWSWQPTARAAMLTVLAASVCVSFGCSSTSGAAHGAVEGPPPPRDGEVRAVVVEPTDEEQQVGGAKTVRILSQEGVTTWIESPAFAATGWSQDGEQRKARYRVVFEGGRGEVSVYWIGTTRSAPVRYLCFGFCDEWWVAPSLEDGSVDPDRFRLMPDKVWHPLAREWYLADQNVPHR